MNKKVEKYKRLSTADRSDNIVCIFLLFPFMFFFTVFVLVPVISSAVLSFFDYDMVSTPIFTGLDNYIRMFTGDSVFITVLGNTLKFAVVTGPISFLLAFVLAWLINEFPPLIRGLLAFLFYSPALVGNAYFIWQILFSGDSLGYANNILTSLGIINEPIQWLKDEAYNTAIIIVVQLWMSMGVSFLANIAGLQNVNTEMYEAGAIDGIRSRWQELWYITLPSMKNILLFGAVMQIQSVFSISAIVTHMAGYPSVNNSVDTIVSLIIDVGTMRYEMGYAATLSVFLFAIMALTRVIVGALMNLLGKQDN